MVTVEDGWRRQASRRCPEVAGDSETDWLQGAWGGALEEVPQRCQYEYPKYKYRCRR